MSGLSMGFGIEAVDMAASCRPKEGLTILESLDNIIPSFSKFLPCCYLFFSAVNLLRER